MSDKDEDKRAVELAQVVKAITDNWVGQVELHQALARLARVKFLALMKEGFTEDQAIRMCRW